MSSNSILYLMLLVSTLACSNNYDKSSTSENVECLQLENFPSVIFFERGFDRTYISLNVNGIECYSGEITTDPSLDLARGFTFRADTLKSYSFRIGNSKMMNFCPGYYITVNQHKDSLVVMSLRELPEYY